MPHIVVVGGGMLGTISALLAAALAIPAVGQGPSSVASVEKVDYFRQVLPILSQHCYGCHSSRQCF